MTRALAIALLTSLGCANLTAGQAPSPDRFRPSGDEGQFQARKIGELLEITLRVKFEFLDGDANLVPGFADAEYSWSEAETVYFKQKFQRRVEDTWSGRYAFQSTARTEKVGVAVKVREVQNLEEADWLIKVRHYPEDSPEVEASTCSPGESHLAGGCEANAETLEWGTAELASMHLIPSYVRDLEIAPVDLWFNPDDAEPSADLLGRPPVWLVTDEGWSARLTGFAGFNEVTTGATPGRRRPTIELAHERAENVRKALVAHACRTTGGRTVDADCEARTTDRIRVISQGAYGDAPQEDRRFVRMEIYSEAPIDTLTHEAGHMLGLGDEASNETGWVGSPVESPDYAALVRWYLDETLLRRDDESIMSRGTVVLRRHYVTFLEALELLSGSPEWSIVDP